MIFEIQPSALSPILGVMNKLIGTKPIIPVLANVKFYESGGHYLLTATSGDQETVLTVELPLENVVGFHPLLVSINELTGMVRAAEGSIFPLTFKTGTHNDGKPSDRQLCLDYGEGEYQLIYQDVSEYPTANVGNPQDSITIPAAAVATMSQAAAFTSTDTLRPVMQSVLLDVDGKGKMNVVASDSRTLFLGTVADVPSERPLQLLFNSRIIGLISQLAPKGSQLELQKSDKFVTIRIYNKADDGQEHTVCRIASRMSEGRFPPYQRIIPTCPNSVLIEGQKFLKAVDRASVCANTATNQLRFDIVPSQPFLTVKAQDIDFSRNARTTLEVKDSCQNVAGTIAIGLRADYLTRCIKAVGTKDLKFTFSEPYRACLLCSTDGNTKALIMPSVIQDE